MTKFNAILALCMLVSGVLIGLGISPAINENYLEITEDLTSIFIIAGVAIFFISFVITSSVEPSSTETPRENKQTATALKDFETGVSDFFSQEQITRQQSRLEQMQVCKNLSQRMSTMLTKYLGTHCSVLSIEDTGAAMEIDFLIGDDDLMVTTQETAIVPYHRIRDLDYWKQLGQIIINNHRVRTNSISKSLNRQVSHDNPQNRIRRLSKS